MRTILFLLLFFICLSSGSVFCAALFSRRYEESLPVSCLCAVFFLCVCGVLGFLGLGFYLYLALAAGLTLFSLVFAARKDRLPATLRLVCTPCFFLFFLVFVYLYFLNSGRLVYEFDGLSHWADVVKAMTCINALSTSPLSKRKKTAHRQLTGRLSS